LAEVGEPGSRGSLPAGTRVGPVKLQVSHVEQSLAFYTDVLGLRLLARDGGRAELGAFEDDRVLIELNERSGARPVPRRGRLGLYHYAILLPERAALGRLLRHFADIGARVGAGDHLVSEALYLSDPDGLGIEVYADRPRKTWRRVGREIEMATDPIDAEDLVRAGGDEPWDGMPAGTVIGHVHLHVGDLAQASAFYSDGLGLDRMVWSYPGALFLAAGGYHHHLGTNTWAGPDAVPPSDDDARLLEWTMVVPTASDVQATAARLQDAGIAFDRDDDELVVRDPWSTAVRVRAE